MPIRPTKPNGNKFGTVSPSIEACSSESRIHGNYRHCAYFILKFQFIRSLENKDTEEYSFSELFPVL